ncbi:MAG: hypothetical protein IJC29_00600 [Clostridia bacterium]|nr:hypothetical protein [Clostridia bacterium]
MNWKTVSIQEYFDKTLEARRRSDESGVGGDYCDWRGTLFVLLRNHEETLAFLENATEREIACAADVLEELAQELPKDKAQSILNIFIKKQEEFPEVQRYSAVEFTLEIKIAQEIIDAKAEP